jgi:hypothetical protein
VRVIESGQDARVRRACEPPPEASAADARTPAGPARAFHHLWRRAVPIAAGAPSVRCRSSLRAIRAP